jgi:hypothetical protein
MGVVVFLAVAGAVLAAFAYFNKEGVQAALTFKILENISTGTSNIDFVLTDPPLVISEHENVVAVLPRTILLEPKNRAG